MLRVGLSFAMLGVFCIGVLSQTTAFTYQGSLKDGANPANGNFDFEFKLFDAVSAGTQQGSTQQRLNVAVANGVFAVSLDFGAGTLPGANRFLEIAVRTAGGGTFTTLAPRQQVNSAPYAVKSLNAATADSVTVAGLPSGSGNYIQNQFAFLQSGSFAINGTGRADILSAGTQFNLGGVRVMSNGGTDNLFVGIAAGEVNSGSANTFVGKSAGASNTSGGANSFFGSNAGQTSTSIRNSFFGASAGLSNANGNDNSFFGAFAGQSNTSSDNAFFGSFAGSANSLGDSNSFFGNRSGDQNTTGSSNTFFGKDSGSDNTTGSRNSFFGRNAGAANTIGSNNSFFGFSADVGSGNLSNASAVGAFSFVESSNALILGAINGVNNCNITTNCDSVRVGIGTTTPSERLHVVGNGLFSGDVYASGNVGIGTTAPTKLLTIGVPEVTTATASVGVFSTTGTNIVVRETTNNIENIFGANSTSGGIFGTTTDNNVNIRTNNTNRLRILNTGEIVILTLGAAGGSSLCLNGSSQISSCSSSLRYKTNIGQFSQGLSIVNKLRPITFDWKDGGMKDVGFGAEDVAKIDPRFVTYNSAGEVEGVKYDRLSVAFANAFKEQQSQIEQQQRQIEELKVIVCSLKADAEICKKQEK